MHAWLIVLPMLVAAWICAYRRCGGFVWTAVIAVGLIALTREATLPRSVLIAAWIVFAFAAVFLNPSPLRRVTVSALMLGFFRRALPRVSQTEQEALDAGTVWWDGELFSGNPDWNKLLA